jgi:hypothetical protein
MSGALSDERSGLSFTMYNIFAFYMLSSLSVCLILRPTVSRPVLLGIKPRSGAYDQISITFTQLRVCWYEAPSLTRGRVCLLQCTIYNIFYCLRYESRSLYLYPPGTGWPGYTPKHWVHTHTHTHPHTTSPHTTLLHLNSPQSLTAI